LELLPSSTWSSWQTQILTKPHHVALGRIGSAVVLSMSLLGISWQSIPPSLKRALPEDAHARKPATQVLP